MLKSMTGFGRCEVNEDGRKITVEMKSVNHRYCELSFRMPKKLNFFEANIRNLIKNYASRGKIDIFVTYEEEGAGEAAVQYNREVAETYVRHMRCMIEEFQLSPDISVTALAKMPDVFTCEEAVLDEKAIWAVLEKALTGAAEKFAATRLAEGERLKADLMEKLDGMLGKIAFIETRSPELLEEYRTKLKEKVYELLGEHKLDETAIATELVIYADKICVDEETVRLRAHIQSMKDTLALAVNVGRKLDFIAQEMNREANTILSKANCLEISNAAIDLKTEIEKIREQIQNIE